MKAETNRELAVAAPGASALLWSSILARLPLAMFSIALLVHAQRLTGSFAVAGLVSGAYAVASAAAAPLLGSVVDRCGQTMVLVCGALATALVLVVDGLLPVSTPAFVLIGLGAATGLFTPPLAACVRTLLPGIVDDPVRLPALFALESTILEVTFVAGPPLALGLGSLWSPGGALVVSGSVMLVRHARVRGAAGVTPVASRAPQGGCSWRLAALPHDQDPGDDPARHRDGVRRHRGGRHRRRACSRRKLNRRTAARTVGRGLTARRDRGH